MTDEHYHRHFDPIFVDTYTHGISEAWVQDCDEDAAWLELEARTHAARGFYDDLQFDEENVA